jgi:hypothetical protein
LIKRFFSFSFNSYFESIKIFLKQQQIDFIQIIVFTGSVVTALLLFLRYYAMLKQATIQRDIFLDNSHFDHFQKATQMFFDEKSTIDAKISSAYLLYDVYKLHPGSADRIIQVINKQLIPFLKCLENRKYCSKSQKIKLVSINTIQQPKQSKKIKVIKDVKKINDAISLYFSDKNNKELREIVKKWSINGNDTERLIATSLEIIKKIIIHSSSLPLNYFKINFSNSVLFDLDIEYSNFCFSNNKTPLENIVFLECYFYAKYTSSSFSSIDCDCLSYQKIVSFENSIYYNSKFIQCWLNKAIFDDANLWGCSFINCDLTDVSFKNTECEGVIFVNCKGLTLRQIKEMRFKNNKYKKFPIIISEKQIISIHDNIDINFFTENFFQTIDEYKEWKSSQ